MCNCTSVWERSHERRREVPRAPAFVPLCVYNRLFGEASPSVNFSIQAHVTRLWLASASPPLLSI